jgi:hypothetical protein
MEREARLMLEMMRNFSALSEARQEAIAALVRNLADEQSPALADAA